MAGRRVASRADGTAGWRARRRRGRLFTGIFVAVAGALVLGLAAWALLPRLLSPTADLGGGCKEPTVYSLLTDETTLPVVTAAVSRIDQSRCVAFEVDVAEQAAIAAKVSSGGNDVPDLWLADSSARVSAVAAATRPEIAVPSIASSPAVVVRGKAAAAPANWSKVLTTAGFLIGDPLTSASAAAALASAVAEGESGAADPKGLAPALGKLAQGSAQKDRATLTDAALLKAAEESSSPAVVSESSWLAYTAANPNTKLTASAPGGGAALADYPIAVTGLDPSRRPGAHAAAMLLGVALGDEDGRRALSDRGLRVPGGAVLATPTSDRFVGAVKALAPTAEGVARATKTWALQAVPFRSLVVMDVSGSMAFDAGGKTRMQLTQQAATGGAALFPDTAALGMWAFSQNMNGSGQDYIELDPIRRMSDVVDGKTQRERLVADIASLSDRVGGATGLYDTALAAYRTVKASYDPLAVNSVILFTDGANEDQGSISLEELLAALNREKDPAKPVLFVTIGITTDADEPVLKQIAAATGGSSYVAKDPADIPKVFSEALVARTARG